MQRKLGVFGGSFDPIHFGHLNMAVELLEHWGLDEVCFVPARLSPFKQEAPPVAAEHRLEMLRLATDPYPAFTLSEMELLRAGPSYTVATLAGFRELYPSAKLYLLLGEDCLGGLEKWKDIAVILDLAQPLLASRSFGAGKVEALRDRTIREAILRGWTETSLLDIEARRLRARLERGACCQHLLPAKVLDYIKSNALYSNDS
jgi:nicotinate-nucleotide adenylyltransferase